MTLGRLRKLIDGLPDSVEVVLDEEEGYRSAQWAHESTAMFDRKTAEWSVDMGEEETPASKYVLRLRVLRIN